MVKLKEFEGQFYFFIRNAKQNVACIYMQHWDAMTPLVAFLTAKYCSRNLFVVAAGQERKFHVVTGP